jgi:hypothetical protein
LPTSGLLLLLPFCKIEDCCCGCGFVVNCD